MKRLVILFVSIVITAIAAVSCQDNVNSLIREKPTHFLNETNVYSSEEGAKAALTGVYSSLISYHYMTRSFPMSLMHHSGRFHGKHGASSDLYQLNPLPNNKFIGNMWANMYQMVNRANDVIANLEESEIEASVADPILGEVHFLRAFTYFNLVRAWGDVPLTLEPTSIANMDQPRAPADRVYEAIIADLEKAKKLMPEPAEQRQGRPNKYAAYALLAKVYVTMAGNDSGSPHWQKAHDNAIVVYNEGPYDLINSYSELWAPQKENSIESMFEIQFNKEYHTRLIRETSLSGRFRNATAWGRVRISKELYTDHVDKYPKDPRIKTTYVDSSYTRWKDPNTPKETGVYPNHGNGGWAKKNFGNPGLNKYYATDVTPSSASNTNFVVMRYADLLLLLAEIENELNGPAGAYKYVNEVLARARTRADGSQAPGPADWSGMTQEEFRSRIMDERKFELVGEFDDWFDTRRRGYEYFKEHVIIPHNTHPDFHNKDFVFPDNPKNMLLPIPESEINSNPEITPADQNSGY